MTLRRADLSQAGEIARLHRLTVRTSLPFLPEIHTPQEDEAYFRDQLMPRTETWVWEEGGTVCGYVAFKPGWVEHLFVHPDHQGRRIGPALLDKAMENRTERRLWTFQKNLRARAFYEARGFVIEIETDGSTNMEKEPDVLYVWRP